MIPGVRTFIDALRDEICRKEKEAGDPFFGREPDTARFTAPKRLAMPVFMTSETMLGLHGRADWQHVDIRLQLFAARMIEELRRKYDIPFWTFQAFRTKEQQNLFYKRGTSKLQYPHAPHCQGKAVDLVHGKFMWELTEQEWAFVGKVGKMVAARMDLPIEWGGDWDFYDPAHWQLPDWSVFVTEHKVGEPIRQTPRAILSRLKGH